MHQIGDLLEPGQFLEDASQADQFVDVSGQPQGRSFGAERGEPTQDVRIATQLIQRADLRVLDTQVVQEMACGSTVATDRVWSQR